MILSTRPDWTRSTTGIPIDCVVRIHGGQQGAAPASHAMHASLSTCTGSDRCMCCAKQRACCGQSRASAPTASCAAQTGKAMHAGSNLA